MKKWVIGALCGITGACFGVMISKSLKVRYLSTTLEKKSEQVDKYNELFQLMNHWVNVKQKGKTLTEFFERKGYKNIAIYGMSFAGETLANELKESSVCIKYGIDKDAKHIVVDFDVITPDDVFEKVDAIIVTSIYYFPEIADVIEKKVECPVISLEEIVYESL